MSLVPLADLGFVAWAYLVQVNDTGEPTLRSQRLLPENLSQFQLPQTEEFRQLVSLAAELTPKHLFRQFGGRMRNQDSFFAALPDHPQRKFIRSWIDSRLQRILNYGPDLPLYRAARDGYPAHQPLQLAPQAAQVHFSCVRKDENLIYQSFLSINGQALYLNEPDAELIGEEPAWLLHASTLYRLAQPVSRARLSAFVRQRELTIPAANVPEFCQKVLPRLLEYSTLDLQGLDLTAVAPPPQFRLRVETDPERLTLRLRVAYDRWELPLDPDEQFFLRLDGGTRLLRIARQPAREREVLQAYRQRLPPQTDALFDQILARAEGWAWLARHCDELQALGLEIVGDRLHPATARFEYRLNPEAGGFILQAQVWFGSQRVDFRALAEAVRRNENFLHLPDGRIGLLPPGWLEDLAPLLETAERRPEGLFLQTVQARMLEQAFGASQDSALPPLDAPDADLPKGLQTELRPYQRAGYDWLLSLHRHRLGGILADEMGLGKTVQTIATLLRAYEAGCRLPSLVVAPSSLLFNWREEIARFAPALNVVTYGGTKRSQLLARVARSQVVLTTYGIVRQDIEFLQKIIFYYLVLDESQHIKNPTTRAAQAIYQLQGEYRLALTGTPIENSTRDLWAQMHFLNPGLLGSQSFFSRYYADPIEKQQNGERAERLRRMVQPLILRRTKEMVAADLPEQRTIVLRCQMTPGQSRLYHATRQQLRSSLFDQEQAADLSRPQDRLRVLTCLQQLRQIALHPALVLPEHRNSDSGKLLLLRDQLDTVLAEGQRVLIFSQYVKLLELVRHELAQRKIDFCYLDGGTGDRAAQVRRFQAADGPPVFLISLLAGGTGLNLTAARYVFILDPWWNPAIEQQALARAHRIGQQQPVLGYKFIAAGTIEEKILALQQQKLQVAGEIIPEDGAWLKELTAEDLAALFE